MKIFLQSKNVILSPIDPFLDDLSDYKGWINDQNSDVFTQHAVFPHTSAKLNDFSISRAGSDNVLWLGIWVKPELKHVGNIDISNIDWVNRTGTFNILVGNTSFQGKGLGYEASHLILNHGFNKLNLERIGLGVHENNDQAVRLYNKIGFKQEGVSRNAMKVGKKRYNTLQMGLLSEEYNFDKSII